tara:strand:+ start:3188 stop:3964 length:777 start_codon:yes stop_codon:yes gene_type:complete
MPEEKHLQVRMSLKGKSPHILALRTIKTTKQTETDNWTVLLASICSMRGKKFPWAPTINRGPSEAVKRWLRKTPILANWIDSDRCLTSPSDWPRALYSAFAPRIIPSPYEIANVDMNGRYATTERAFRDHLTLLLYCMGLTQQEIARGHGCTEREVLRSMYAAIENLHDLPSYILWASGTDFSRCVIPPSPKDVSLKKRSTFVTAIKRNPFSADKSQLDQFISSPPYLSYLLYSSPKRMRLTKGCRIYRTSEALDEST